MKRKERTEQLLVLMEEISKFPVKIDGRKLVETHWMLFNGHPETSHILFSRERIFWLMDDKSSWLLSIRTE